MCARCSWIQANLLLPMMCFTMLPVDGKLLAVKELLSPQNLQRFVLHIGASPHQLPLLPAKFLRNFVSENK